MESKIFFAGDFLISNETNNKKIISDRLQQRIDECDIVCCNFEGPIVYNSDLKPMKKIGPNIKNNIKNVQKLINSKFNLFCLANNHIFDYGKEGIKNTIEFFENNNVDIVGANVEKEEIYKYLIKEINNKKIGIINVAENGFGAAVEDEKCGYAYMLNEKVFYNIEELNKKVDFLIVIVHAGAEHWDMPLPEIRNLYKKFIDLGANIIIGHHPHVIQGIEEYRKGLIVYSLGNFAFDMGNGAQNNHTYSIIINLLENNELKYEILPTNFEDGLIDIDKTECNVFNKKFNSNNELLNNEKKYMEEINKNCMKYYEHYKECYGRILCIYKGGLKERLKGFLKKYILRKKFQDIWLYHNINIETHLWIAKRASRLALKSKDVL